jgi:hypothetical protein
MSLSARQMEPVIHSGRTQAQIARGHRIEAFLEGTSLLFTLRLNAHGPPMTRIDGANHLKHRFELKRR